MTLDEAINTACANVGILPPSSVAYGRWIKTNTLSGRNGQGDGRLLINDAAVTAYNWQTGEKCTLWLKDISSPVVRRQVRQDMAEIEEKRRKKAEQAAAIATRMVEAATMQTHPYLARKGFPDELALVLDAASIRAIVGKYSDYLLVDGGEQAIVMPARKGKVIASVQLIWESGEKKFLANGSTAGAFHRIATGKECWLCEGIATGLSLMAVLKSLHLSPTVLCCFSASNVARVASNAQGRVYIAADHDKPLEQFGGLGAGEYYARRSGAPYFMPPTIGEDFNDMHQREGLFAAQRAILEFLKGVRK